MYFAPPSIREQAASACGNGAQPAAPGNPGGNQGPGSVPTGPSGGPVSTTPGSSSPGTANGPTGNPSALSKAGGQGNPPAAPTPPPCPPAPAPPPLPDPATVARGIALPWPTLAIRAQPAPVGLDGLPTWFWLEGFTGQPITASSRIQVGGLPNAQPGCPGGAGAEEDVAVQAMPVAYTWHFGDDRATSSLTSTAPGVPYPQQDGAITHQYEDTSRGSGFPDGFMVQMNAQFRLQFRTGNGAWQALQTTDRQATLRYRVQQAYPVIVGP